MGRRFASVLGAVALVMVCCGGIPTDRSVILEPGGGRLMLLHGKMYFSKNFGGEQWYMLSTRIKRAAGSFLAHRAEGEPQDAVYLSEKQHDGDCGWAFDQEGIEQPGKQHWSAPKRRLVRIKVSGGPFDGYYLGAAETVDEVVQQVDPSSMIADNRSAGRKFKLGRRAVLVREREKAPILEVQQYFIHK